jgi:hypothetical protein
MCLDKQKAMRLVKRLGRPVFGVSWRECDRGELLEGGPRAKRAHGSLYTAAKRRRHAQINNTSTIQSIPNAEGLT